MTGNGGEHIHSVAQMGMENDNFAATAAAADAVGRVCVCVCVCDCLFASSTSSTHIRNSNERSNELRIFVDSLNGDVCCSMCRMACLVRVQTAKVYSSVFSSGGLRSRIRTAIQVE